MSAQTDAYSTTTDIGVLTTEQLWNAENQQYKTRNTKLLNFTVCEHCCYTWPSCTAIPILGTIAVWLASVSAEIGTKMSKMYRETLLTCWSTLLLIELCNLCL